MSAAPDTSPAPAAGVPGALLLPAGAAGLRERKKAATRRALGVAAMRLAAERGTDNVLVEDIAGAAGVSPRTFSNYFASKHEAICAPGLDRALRIGTALAARPAAEPLWEAITAAVMSSCAPAGQPPDQDWLDGIRLVSREPALRGEYLKVQARTQCSLAEAIGLRAGPQPGSAAMFPRILAAAVAAAVQAATEQWLSAGRPADLAPLIRAGLDQLAAGMRQVLPP